VSAPKVGRLRHLGPAAIDPSANRADPAIMCAVADSGGDSVRRSILPIVAVYGLAILIGLVLPAVAVARYCAIAVFLVVPFGVLGRLFSRRA
jgi:hypothetical protein